MESYCTNQLNEPGRLLDYTADQYSILTYYRMIELIGSPDGDPGDDSDGYCC